MAPRRSRRQRAAWATAVSATIVVAAIGAAFALHPGGGAVTSPGKGFVAIYVADQPEELARFVVTFANAAACGRALVLENAEVDLLAYRAPMGIRIAAGLTPSPSCTHIEITMSGAAATYLGSNEAFAVPLAHSTLALEWESGSDTQAGTALLLDIDVPASLGPDGFAAKISSVRAMSGDIDVIMAADRTLNFNAVPALEARTQALSGMASNANFQWPSMGPSQSGRHRDSDQSRGSTNLLDPDLPADALYGNHLPTLQLVAPAANAMGIPLFTMISWTAWDADDNQLTFTVMLGTENPPTGRACEGIGQLFCIPPELEPNSTYFWSVEVDDGQGANVSSPVNVFRSNAPPSVPVPVSPMGNWGFDPGGTVFEWKASVDPEGDTIKYHVEIELVPDPPTRSRAACAQTVGTSCRVTTLAPLTTYYWSVTACDAALCSESEPRQFKMAATAKLG